jgi:phage terminase large subunit-like protein
VCCQEAEFFIVKKEGQQTLIVESFLDNSQARTWNDKTLLGICRQHYIRLAQIASFARNAKNALQTLSMVALYGYDPSSLVKLGELLQNLGASAANGQYLQGLAQAILDKAEV